MVFFLDYQVCDCYKWILMRFLVTPVLWVLQPRVQYMCGAITNLDKQAERVKNGTWGFQSSFLLSFLDVLQVLITIGWTLLVVGSILQLWPQTARFLLGVSLFLDVFSLKLLEPKAMSNIHFFWIATLSKGFNWGCCSKNDRYFMERRNLAVAISVAWELGERGRGKLAWAQSCVKEQGLAKL